MKTVPWACPSAVHRLQERAQLVGQPDTTFLLQAREPRIVEHRPLTILVPILADAPCAKHIAIRIGVAEPIELRA